jgi:hypothetical protein
MSGLANFGIASFGTDGLGSLNGIALQPTNPVIEIANNPVDAIRVNREAVDDDVKID